MKVQMKINKEKKQRSLVKRVLILTLGVVLLTLCCVGLGMLGLAYRPKVESRISKVVDTALEDVVERTIPAVVHIQYYGDDGKAWQGSGVIISEDGTILTARHVVESTGRFIVTLNNGQRITTNKSCVSKDYDIGFLKLPVGGLPTAKLGNSDHMRLGTRLLAIGSQFGADHFNSVTLGVLSAIDRKNLDEPGYGWSVLLQTDVSANPGSSGGPIFNMDGEIVGIVVGGPVLPYAGIVYCVPSNVCKSFVNSTSIVFSLQELTSVSGDVISERLNELDSRITEIERVKATLASVSGDLSALGERVSEIECMIEILNFNLADDHTVEVNVEER